MSMQLLSQQMSGLRIRSCDSGRAFSSAKNGFCGQRLVSQIKQRKLEPVGIVPEIQCGKMKTRKAAAKRFSVTGTGKIRRRRPGKQHINEKMARGKVRVLGKVMVVNKRDVANVSPNLPYSGVPQSRN